MNKLSATVTLGFILAMTGAAQASAVSQREYKRGYNDCLRGEYDQNQHGASYKRGCRAAEDSGKSNGEVHQSKVDANQLRGVCRGAVIGRFHHFTRSVKFNKVEHMQGKWQVYGDAVLDDSSSSVFVCIFSSNGHLVRLEASQPMGGHTQEDDDGYCPQDVAEANRYQYPGCN
jgi:hypothetical protein